MGNNRITENRLLKALTTGVETKFLDSGRKMIDMLDKLGAEECRELSVNGWDCDFWATYEYNGKYYSIFGCAFDGYVTIQEDEDEDED